MGVEQAPVPAEELMMGDVVMGLVMLAFFFLCIGYVSWCGRIIGPDPEHLDAVDDAAAGQS